MIKKIGIVSAAAFASQLLQFAAQPILATLAPVPAFGRVAELASLATFISIVASLQLHIAYLSENDEHHRRLLQRSAGPLFLCAGALTALISIGLGWMGLHEHDLVRRGLLFGLLTWSYCAGNFQISVFVKSEAFGSVAAFTMGRALLVVLLQYGMLRAGSVDGLLYGLVVGEVVSRICSQFLPGGVFIRWTGWLRGLRAVLSRYRHFVGFGTIQEVAAAFNFLMPVFAATAHFGAAAGGLFAVANKMTWAPVQLVNQGAGAILTSRLSIVESERIVKLSMLYLVGAFVVFIGAFLVLWGFADLIIIRFFSKEWDAARPLVTWLAAWAAAFLAALPARYLIRVRRWQAGQLVIEAMMTVGAVSILVTADDIQHFSKAISIAGVMQNLCIVLMVVWMVSRGRVADKEGA